MGQGPHGGKRVNRDFPPARDILSREAGHHPLKRSRPKVVHFRRRIRRQSPCLRLLDLPPRFYQSAFSRPALRPPPFRPSPCKLTFPNRSLPSLPSVPSVPLCLCGKSLPAFILHPSAFILLPSSFCLSSDAPPPGSHRPLPQQAHPGHRRPDARRVRLGPGRPHLPRSPCPGGGGQPRIRLPGRRGQRRAQSA